MDIYSQILAFTVPALVVGLIAYLLIDKLLKADDNRRNFEIHKAAVQTITPAKLRAYERMVLFLERIAPESLLTRMNFNNVSALQLQTSLLQQIRQEWEHNLSQQLYITNDTWTMLCNAKESTVQLVNTCAAEASLNSSALDYAKLIIQTFNESPKTPSSIALSMLKADVAKLG